MTDTDNEDLGVIARSDDRYEAQLERVLDHDTTAVWAILTEPDKFVDWLAPGTLELSVGGRAKLDFVDSGIVIDSEVTACEPEKVIEYSWSGPGEPLRPLRFELDPVDGGCRLTMHLSTPLDEDIARSCAGFEAHLMMLIGALEGVPINFPFERFVETRDAYNKMLASLD